MSNKTLSISIAAYNVQSFLDKAISSCIIEEYEDDFEVIVVNDGSTDNTIDIIKKYQSKYPEVVRIIDKENGGYGSTINSSLKIATGKYFKLLDGDDYCISNGLIELIELLKKTSSDMVLSDVIWEDFENKVIKDSVFDECEMPENGKYFKSEINSYAKDHKNFRVPMWMVTYKTDVLRRSRMTLPEHTFYTDNLFVLYPFIFIENLEVMKIPVYCYRVGRDGQSFSKESLRSHRNELKKS